MKILVGISGSIGALSIHRYLLNLLSETEVEELRAIMTPTAARFLNPRALEALLRKPVHVDPWIDQRDMYAPPDLVKDIDLYLIAPASATTLSRCANGSAETLVANCYLCHPGPTAFAPSMSQDMWEHPAVRRNIDLLKSFGASILSPGEGFSVTKQRIEKGSLCSYREMWTQIKHLVGSSGSPKD